LEENKQLKARINALEIELVAEQRSNKALQSRAPGKLTTHFQQVVSFSPTRAAAPPGSAGPLLLKRNGRRGFEGELVAVIPQAVDDGQPCNQWPAVCRPFSKGLQNPGNFCYRNAMLQALLHTPAFYRYLGLMHKECYLKHEACVVCALQFLARDYWSIPAYNEGPYTGNSTLDGPEFTLNSFNQACRANLPQDQELKRDFVREDQSEASDFLRYLLDQVKDKELQTDGTTFRKTFELEYNVRWICLDCEEVYDGHHSGGPVLPVKISGEYDQGEGLPLRTYLDRNHNDRQERRCESEECKRIGRPGATGDGIFRTVKTRITHSPDILIVWITRFWQDPTNNYEGHKILLDIEFEEQLDLGHLTADRAPLRYRLDGVVAHRGPDLRHGHYISAVRKVNGEDDDEFHTIDDDRRLRQHRGGDFQEMRYPASEQTNAAAERMDKYAEDAFWPTILVYSKVS
jgi:uncharacterized UBP type Zn finger protein